VSSLTGIILLRGSSELTDGTDRFAGRGAELRFERFNDFNN